MSGFHEVWQEPCQWAWSLAIAGDQMCAVVVVIEVSSPEAGCRSVLLEGQVLSAALPHARVLVEDNEGVGVLAECKPSEAGSISPACPRAIRGLVPACVPGAR